MTILFGQPALVTGGPPPEWPAHAPQLTAYDPTLSPVMYHCDVDTETLTIGAIDSRAVMVNVSHEGWAVSDAVNCLWCSDPEHPGGALRFPPGTVIRGASA